MFFISLEKLFLFSRKSNFRVLDIQISWRHQMPKHKTRNTVYWITWDKFGQFMSYCKRKAVIKKTAKILQKLRPENWFQTLLCLQRITHNLVEVNDIFRGSYLHLICNSKAIKICPNQHAELLKFLFTDNSLKIEKDWS